MHYEYTAIPDAEVPVGIEPAFWHTVTINASEVNKTVGVWRAVPDALLDFRPHEKVNTIRTILAHQLLSEHRFFAEFAGRDEPPVEELLPSGAPAVQNYIDKYVWLARKRLGRAEGADSAHVGRRSGCGHSGPRSRRGNGDRLSLLAVFGQTVAGARGFERFG